MRVGTACYACDSGLGLLARSFWRRVTTDVRVVHHSRHPTHYGWYTGQPSGLQAAAFRSWLEGLDVFLAFETPFLWEAFRWCRELGVRSALVTMYECTPARLLTGGLPQPDAYLCPSLLDCEVFGGWSRRAPPPRPFRLAANADGTLWAYAPVPVETPWRRRGEVRTFVHNAGHGGLRGRNGTAEAVAAWRHVRSGARLVLRAQEDAELPSDVPSGVHVRIGTVDRASLYEEGEAFLFPDKFNGLSLPLQEAYASGMLVVSTARFPASTWLPEEPLVPARSVRRARVGPPYLEFDECAVHPEDIAAKVDGWYGRDAGAYSDAARRWAASMSWDELGTGWNGALEELRRG